MPPSSYIRSQRDGDVIPNPEKAVWVTHQRVRVHRDDRRTVLDAGGAEFGVRGADGCHGLRLEGLAITNAGHGTRLTNAQNVVISHCVSHHNGGEGFHVGGLVKPLVEHCEAFENGWKNQEASLGIPRHGCHGFYLDATDLKMRHCESYKNDGCGLHLRGANPLIEDCSFYRNLLNTGAGAPDVQLTSVQKATFKRCLISNGNGGLTCHTENGRGTREVELEHCTIYHPRGRFATNVSAGSDPPRLVNCLVIGDLDGVARPIFVDLTRHALSDEGLGWLDDQLRSLVSGVGWPGPAAQPPQPDPIPPGNVEAELRATIQRLEAKLREAQGQVNTLQDRVNRAKEALG